MEYQVTSKTMSKEFCKKLQGFLNSSFAKFSGFELDDSKPLELHGEKFYVAKMTGKKVVKVVIEKA